MRSPWLTSIWGPGIARLTLGVACAILGIGAILARLGDADAPPLTLGVALVVAGVAIAVWGLRHTRAWPYLRG